MNSRNRSMIAAAVAKAMYYKIEGLIDAAEAIEMAADELEARGLNRKTAARRVRFALRALA